MLQKLLTWLKLAVEQERGSDETGTQMEICLLNMYCLTEERATARREPVTVS